MRPTHPIPFVLIAVVALAMVAGCAPSVKSPGPVATGSARPVASASASASAVATPSPEPAFTIHDVRVDIGPVNENPLWYFASGHWLYASDLNDTIVYDGRVVAQGHPVTAALSQNGLHYAYTLAKGLSVYIDGHAVATGTYIPEVFAVSDDGASVLYSDTAGRGGVGSIYRNGVAIFRATNGIGEAVGSADAMHYTAIIVGVSETMVHDGQMVADSGITGGSAPLISPDGAHYGLDSAGQDGGVTSVDGVPVLPANEWGRLYQITDSGHWVLVDYPRGSVPIVDGVVKGPSADQAVISTDGRQIALDTLTGAILVNGKSVGRAPRDPWLEIEGNTLYVYNIVMGG
jgi:hypothetical protein